MTSDSAPPAHTRLTLIRHGESNVTVNRVIGGVRSCSGLSDLGREQAQRLGARWADGVEMQPDLLISSDFPRAVETAQIVALSTGWAPDGVEQLPAFGEHDPGPDIDGMTFAAYVERFGTPEWSGDPHVEIFPGGETTAQFHTRVHDALDALLSGHAGKNIVLICHGGVIDATFRRLLGLGMTGAVQLQAINTSITEFVTTTSGPWQLVRYNDAAHLAGLAERTPRVDRV